MDELKCTALALNEDETAHALIYSRMGRGAALLGGDAYPMQKNINAADWAARDTLQLVLGDETAEVFGQKDGSFPAALDALLYARWQAKKPGLIVLSCAAAEHNAQHLLEAAIACAVARHAQPGYLRYLVSDNAFCATLSDCAEWLIEADEKTAARLPLPKSDAVRCVPDLSPYALRRTRMLGGAGAMAAVCACLAGVETMGENLLARYVRAILPAITEYEQKNAALPRRLAFAVSALIMLYSGVRPDDQGVYTLAGKDGSMPVLDRAEALQAFSRLSCDMPCEALAYAALSDCEIWGCDLREIEGLEELATEQLRDMQLLGVCEAMRKASK